MRRLLANIWGAFGSPGKATVWSHRIAASMRCGPVLSLILCGGLLVTAIIVGTVIMIGDFRERALGNSERELENTVLLLSRHFDQQFEDIEIIASNLISVMQLSDFDSPETFRSRMSGPSPHLVLKSRASALSYIADVKIFDSDGELINSSAAWPPPAISIADRAFFKTLKSDPGARFILSEAVRSYTTGSWSTVLAHRLSAPDGTFLGVMARRIDPLHFQEFLATIALGEGAAIAMFHRDGTMLARYPHVDSMIGQKFKGAPLLNKILIEGGRQTLRLQSPVDGMQRLGSAAALSRVPIVVVATTTAAAALSDWRAQARLIVTAAVLAALVIALILYLIVRQLARQGRESQQRLKLQKQQLDTALNNMIQGLVLYDASARIIFCNRRYIDMYNLSTDVVKPGCHFYDLIRHRQQTGSFDGDIEEFCSTIMRNVAHGKITCMTSEAVGRWYVIANTPLAQGGWVATIEDVTERRNLEQERDRNYAFLRQIIDHIPTQITVKDLRDGRYVLANRVAETHFGLPCDEIVGKTARDLFPKEAADLIAADDEKALNCPDGLLLDIGSWQTPAGNQRFITSKRIGIPDQSGEPRYLINVVDDISDRRRADEKIAHLAHYDALTDLPNRVLFREQIERELRKTADGEKFALLYIDVDEFKGINDSLGHHVGDELLKAVAGRIRSCIGESDLIARLGGDEFAVIQTGFGSVPDVVAFVTPASALLWRLRTAPSSTS
jgi:PAS domain S-box-containing protein